jgi:hypothetical protein
MSSVRRIWRMSSSQHQQTSIVSSHECKRLSDTELKAHPSDFVFAWCSCKRSLPESVSATLYQPRIPPQRDRQNLTAKRSCPVTNQSIDRYSRPRWLCCIMVVGGFNLLQQRPSFPPRPPLLEVAIRSDRLLLESAGGVYSPKGPFVPAPSNLGGLFALCWLMALANFAPTNTLSGDAVKKSVASAARWLSSKCHCSPTPKNCHAGSTVVFSGQNSAPRACIFPHHALHTQEDSSISDPTGISLARLQHSGSSSCAKTRLEMCSAQACFVPPPARWRKPAKDSGSMLRQIESRLSGRRIKLQE